MLGVAPRKLKVTGGGNSGRRLTSMIPYKTISTQGTYRLIQNPVALKRKHNLWKLATAPLKGSLLAPYYPDHFNLASQKFLRELDLLWF